MTDESIPILALFCNVVELHLSGNDFTILPESIKEFCSLRKLILNDGKKLREIRGIPPNIEELSAANCMSLTPSCTSMLLNEEYNGYTRFHLPGSSIPKWFEHSSRNSVSFWFRNNIPLVSVCVVSRSDGSGYTCTKPKVIINGNKHDSSVCSSAFIHVADHITIDRVWILSEDLLACDELLSENEWNHVEFRVTCNCNGWPLMKEFGIHVHKPESNMEDIRFIEPRGDLDPITFIQDTDVDPSFVPPATQLHSDPCGEPTLLCAHYECWGKPCGYTD